MWNYVVLLRVFLQKEIFVSASLVRLTNNLEFFQFSKLFKSCIRNIIEIKLNVGRKVRIFFLQFIYTCKSQQRVVHRGEEKVARFSIVGGYFWYNFLIGFTFYRKLAFCLRIYDEMFYEAKFLALSFPVNYAQRCSPQFLLASSPSNSSKLFQSFCFSDRKWIARDFDFLKEQDTPFVPFKII